MKKKNPEVYFFLFTGRNEVVAKVMFLQVCVCPRGGGESVCLSACWDAIPPRDQADPPRIRQTLPWDQATPPGPGRHTPPGPGRHPPPGPGRPPLGPGRPSPLGKQTPAYGLRAAGTHPTGLHSCFPYCCILQIVIVAVWLQWINCT